VGLVEMTRNNLAIKKEIADTVCNLLRNIGFDVERDAPKQGKSGITYNFDIIGKSFCKIFDVEVGVLIKVGHTLTVNDIIIFHGISEDTGIDKIVVITDKAVSPQVKSLADYFNIGLVDIEKLSSVGAAFNISQMKVLKHYHVKPKLTIDEARKKAKCDKGLFGSCKGKHVATILGYLPLYEYKVSLESPPKGESQIEFRETALDFESIRGSMVSVDESGTLRLENLLVNIGDIPFEVVEVARYIAEHGPLTKEELSEIVSIDERKLERIILVLMDKMIIDVYGDTYTIKPLSLSKNYRNVSQVYPLENGVPSEGETLHPYVSPEKLEYLLEAFGTVHNIKVIYYPVYINIYAKSDVIYRVKMVDGNTGRRLDDFEELLEHTDDIRRIVSKIGAL
jgi:hypothetical protein